MKGKGNSDDEPSYEEADLKRSKMEQTRTEGRESSRRGVWQVTERN